MPHRSARRGPLPAVGLLAPLLVVAALALEPPGSCMASAEPVARWGPTRIPMSATARARGASATMVVGMAASPFGIAVQPDGSYRYRVAVQTEGLVEREDVRHVVWAATPDLDRHLRLGTLGPDGRVEGEITWNKFLVFVTAEDFPDPERWSDRILFSALSPSGRMHTMAGHGPFSGEPCLDPRP